MKNISTLFLITIIPIICNAQNSKNKREENPDLQIQVNLIADSDTLEFGKSLNLHLYIENISGRNIYIPKNIDITSDMLPNGTGGLWDGAVVRLKFDPLPTTWRTTIENLSAASEIEFIKLPQNTSIKIPLLDLQKYLDAFNKRIKTSEYKIETGKTYKLRVAYSNRWTKKRNKSKIFLGQVVSQEVDIYIKN